jgi:hypothetical protein
LVEVIQVGQNLALLREQMLSFFPFLLESAAFGLTQPAIFSEYLMALDGPGHHPDQRAYGGGMDADIAVGSRFVAEGGHFLFALIAQHEDRFFGAAGSVPCDQFEGIEFARDMADQDGIEGFVSKSGQTGHTPFGLFQ